MGVNPDSLTRLQTLVRHLREEAVPNWICIDPNPPHANLTYSEIDEILPEIQAFLPEAGQRPPPGFDPAARAGAASAGRLGARAVCAAL